jgi:hypothetical protein
MVRAILIAALVAGIAGCASAGTTATEIYLPSGDVGYDIRCNGTSATWNECLRKVSDLCGAQGYQVVEGSLLEDRPRMPVFGVDMVHRAVVVQCGAATEDR